MGLDHADFPIVRNRRIKKTAGEKATDSSSETFDKHRISYYEGFVTVRSELQDLVLQVLKMSTKFLGF